MREPDTRKDLQERAPVEGGKVLQRLLSLQRARGITPETREDVAGAIARGVAEALQMAPPPPESLGSGPADTPGAAVASPETLAQAGAPAGPPGPPVWYFLGPDLMPNGQTYGSSRVPVSGRVGAIAVDPSNRGHILCGSAGGGVWESFSSGASWQPRTDAAPTLNIGAPAFDPRSPHTVYAGTGEGNFYSWLGQGLLRSTDGGTTWSMLATAPFVGLGFFRIIVDPANSKHILAATTGGMYESSDMGSTWTQRIAGECWDISMSPAGGAAAEVLATTTTGLQRSTNGGTAWAAQALPGAPASWSRLAVSIAPSDPTVAYAFGASGGTGYLWRRSGGAWTAATLPAGLSTGQAWYDWYCAAARDSNTQVFLGAIDAYCGSLSGSTWNWLDISTKTSGDSIHPDQHAIAFDPVDPSTIYCGSDGGLFRSPNRGINWTALNCGLGITEIEYLAEDNANSRWLIGGTQDNGSIRYFGTTAWEHAADGDGGDCGVNQATPTTVYHSYYGMGMERSTTQGAWASWTWIGPKVPAGYNALFYPPMAVANTTVAQAGQSVFISRDTGTTWTEVALPAGLIASALSAPDPNHVFAATENGRVFRIQWNGAAWAAPVEVTSPRAAYVSSIRVDPANLNSIWLTSSQVGGGRVFHSADGGTTWADRTGGLPNLPVNSAALDPANANRVWVSADVGVYQTTDSGTTWAAFFTGLPNVLVEDLEFHAGARVLRAATRNRGAWEVAVDVNGSSQVPLALDVCAVTNNADGRLEVFAAGTDDAQWHIWQTAINNGWSNWGSLGGVITSATAGANNKDGRLEIFARGTDGALWHMWQTAINNGWSGWASLGGVITSRPAVIQNADGRLEVFARGTDGALYHISQTAPNNGWSGWASLGGVISDAPVVGRNADGRLEVFARGGDGALYHIWQTAPNNGWSGWSSLGGVITSRPTVVNNADGRLEVFARGSDGALWHVWQTAINNGWSNWGSLGGVITSDPSIQRNKDGRLEVFARGTDNALWHIWQTAANNGWSNWTSFGGVITSNPHCGVNQDGRLEVFARGTDNALWHIWQTAPNNGWSGWASAGGVLVEFPAP